MSHHDPSKQTQNLIERVQSLKKERRNNEAVDLLLDHLQERKKWKKNAHPYLLGVLKEELRWAAEELDFRIRLKVSSGQKPKGAQEFDRYQEILYFLGKKRFNRLAKEID